MVVSHRYHHIHINGIGKPTDATTSNGKPIFIRRPHECYKSQ